MRPSISVPLMMMFFLVRAQGIRLEPASVSAKQQKIHVEEQSLIGGNGVEEVVICRDGLCSGRSRKLMTKSEGMEVKVTPKKDHSGDKFDKNEENFSVKPTATSEQRQPAAAERYPDILDIAGMDYSPARRKPPIHN